MKNLRIRRTSGLRTTITLLLPVTMLEIETSPFKCLLNLPKKIFGQINETNKMNPQIP